MEEEECPIHGKFTIAFDYHRVKRCMIDGCSVRIIDNKYYSVLRYNPKTNSVDRVKIERGGETIVNPEVLRSYKLD